MRNPFKACLKRLLNIYPRWACKREFERQSLDLNERAIEYAFVFRQLARIYPRRILDVGTGTTALPHLMRNCGFFVTAIDNVKDFWPSGMLNRHYHVIDVDITRPRLREKFDLVTCISVLEHISESDTAVRNMFSLLNPGGHLILTTPYTERGYVRNVYDLPSSDCKEKPPYVCQSYSRNELRKWQDENHAEAVEQEYWQCWEGEAWSTGAKVVPPRQVSAEERHQLTCILLRRKP